jgi:restriction system protein
MAEPGDGRAGDVESPPPMRYLDAAERVLGETANREPFSYRTITERALERGYLISGGLTPADTMRVQLGHDVKRRVERGDEPRFTQFPEGRFGLAAWQEDDLATLIARHNRAVKAELLGRIQEMDSLRFQALVAELLTRLGFDDVVESPPTNDGGIDVVGVLVIGGVIRTQMAVQVKRWRHNVQAPTVQQLRGALGAHDQGLVITTSDFSAGARKEAAKPDRSPVALMSGTDLVSLLVEYQIGVQRENHDLLGLTELPGSVSDAGSSAEVAESDATAGVRE